MPPQTTVSDDDTPDFRLGSGRKRFRVPPIIGAIIEAFADDTGVPIATAAGIFFQELEKQFHAPAGKLASTWGGTWTAAIVGARTKLEDAARDRQLATTIEWSKLHRSSATASGFVGVYRNGKGYRAMGKCPETGKELYLGQRRTAHEAAQLRLEHYTRHNLPYGDLELAVEHERRVNGMKGTDREIAAFLLNEAERHGTTHRLVPPGAPPDQPQQLGAPPASPALPVVEVPRQLVDADAAKDETRCTKCNEPFYEYQLVGGVCFACRTELEDA